MNTVLWAEAQSLILPDLKDCPWEMAESRLILAAREFFSRSQAWRGKLDAITSIAGVADYPEIVEQQHVDIVRVLSAYYGDTPIEPLVATDFFEEQREDPGTEARPSFMTVEGDVLYLHRAPLESGVVIHVEATYKPALSATGLPQDLWGQYIEHIAEGAKARLYASQAKPYSDLNLAAAARSVFNREISKAYMRASKGMTRGRRRVQGYFY